MRWKLTDQTATPTYVVVLDQGDEAFAVISDFARAHNLTAAQVTAVGAFESATVGWFDRQARQYRRIPVDEQCEVLSLLGDIAAGPEGPQPHLHVVVGLPTGPPAAGTCWTGGCGRRSR